MIHNKKDHIETAKNLYYEQISIDREIKKTASVKLNERKITEMNEDDLIKSWDHLEQELRREPDHKLNPYVEIIDFFDNNDPELIKECEF